MTALQSIIEALSDEDQKFIQRKARVLTEEMTRHAESLAEVRTAPADRSGKRFQALALEQSEHPASRTARAFIASFPLRD